jgi:hypothetical protein
LAVSGEFSIIRPPIHFMPLPIDISALLSGSLVESERMELKEGWNPESVLHTLCCSVIVNYGPSNEKWEAWNQEWSGN